MSERKTVISIITETYYNSDDSQEACCCIIDLTQEELDLFKHLSELAKENDLDYVAKYYCAAWYDLHPLMTFEQLGSKFIQLRKYDDYTPDFGKTLDEYDSSDQDHERMDTELVHIDSEGFYFVAYGKYSGNKTESIKVTFAAIEEEMAKPEPTPRHKYYFPTGEEYPKTLEDVPKYLNFRDKVMVMFCTEFLEKGEA